MKATTLDENPDTYEEAKRLYWEALTLDPSLTAKAYINLGNICYQQSNRQGARDLYTLAMGLDPKEEDAYYNLGILDFEEGNYKAAKKRFLQALNLQPDYLHPRYHLAIVLEELGEKARARAHWKMILKIDPDYKWAGVVKQRLEDLTSHLSVVR